VLGSDPWPSLFVYLFVGAAELRQIEKAWENNPGELGNRHNHTGLLIAFVWSAT